MHPHLLLLLASWLHVVNSLTLLERNELARKFKYYFASVRPVSRDNYISDENGTRFSIDTELHILNSIRTQNSIAIEAFVLCTFVDDRLILRELHDRFEITEFEPWKPRIGTSPPTQLKINYYLSPQTGELNYYYRVKEVIPCSGDSWRHPFEVFNCELAIENAGDELLRVVDHRDARPRIQMRQVGLEIEEWPVPLIRLWFRATWHTALVSVYLPSFLVFAVVVFAQWKRRKIQVIVTVAALVCIIILLSSQRSYPTLTMKDLWLCSTFLHTVFLLIVDVTLPARRVKYTLLVDVNGRPANLASPETSPDAPRATVVHRAPRAESEATTVESVDTEVAERLSGRKGHFPISWTREEDDGWPSPLLQGRKAMMAIQKFAGKHFAQQKSGEPRDSRMSRSGGAAPSPDHRQHTWPPEADGATGLILIIWE
ncbi:unnamed protein product, partial [Mesorhabditis spiculigera]